ncbi:MAG TPA: ATP synthase F1 subunit epsilon [Silvibacterium sp.]|nr:ATP synthase F1 subunit epsilon [Silvibacterium sp.]
MADTNHLQVRLVTPDRILVDQTVDAVEVPSKSGYFEVLYGHAPLLAELAPGEVRLHGGRNEAGDRFSVARGFVEVLPERVTILAESAMKPEEIDTAAAQQELSRGQKLWSEAGDDPEKYSDANEIMREAESRIDSAKG